MSIFNIFNKKSHPAEYFFPPDSILQQYTLPSNTDTSQVTVVLNALNSYGISCEAVQYSSSNNTSIIKFKCCNINDYGKINNNLSDILSAYCGFICSVSLSVGGFTVEIQNNSNNILYLSECIKYMNQCAGNFVIGQRADGYFLSDNISNLPHMLIAGATGSGKSVFINSLITSILFSSTPSEVKFVLIDIKRVELNQYSGIPHLMTDIIKEKQDAIKTLNSLVSLMNERYNTLEKAGCRNIDEYNASHSAKYPRIAVIIDELADLMLTDRKSVETPIIRLAQLARSAGIHLIIATQRPDRNVITGLLKANIPAKICFTVSSRINSEIILDEIGAENLKGNGDALYLANGALHPVHVQTPYTGLEDVRKVVDYIKNNSFR